MRVVPTIKITKLDDSSSIDQDDISGAAKTTKKWSVMNLVKRINIRRSSLLAKEKHSETEVKDLLIFIRILKLHRFSMDHLRIFQHKANLAPTLKHKMQMLGLLEKGKMDYQDDLRRLTDLLSRRPKERSSLLGLILHSARVFENARQIQSPTSSSSLQKAINRGDGGARIEE